MIPQSKLLTFQDLSLEVFTNKNDHKTVLKELSGHFSEGLNAIMGSSGCGKTSLLNTLAKRIDKTDTKIKLSGNIKFNGMQYELSQFKRFGGYVMQDDYLLANLTVLENLEFAADMRLNLSSEEKMERVNKVIKDIGLTNCKSTRIGDSLLRGISGGERKRCCIAAELLNNPQTILLDEPTSGLDSFTSFRLMKMLKDLSIKEKIVMIFTIHQPSSDIWQLFDRFTLMSEGKFIFHGQSSDVLPFFSQIGFECPRYSNPADFLISIVPSNTLFINQHFMPQIENQNLKEINIQINVEDEIKQSKENNLFISTYQAVPTSIKIKKLLKRQFAILTRNKIMINARLLQVTINSIFVGLIYFRLDRESTKNEDAFPFVSVLFMISVGMFVQSMNPQVISFSEERVVFLRETSANMYPISTYFLSKIIPELITCSIFPIINILILYWMTNLTPEPGRFFFLILLIILQSHVGNAFGILAGSLFKESKLAISFAIIFVAPQFLFGGLFKNRADYPTWIGWVEYITPTFYTFDASIRNEFEGRPYQVNPIDSLNMNIEKWECVGILIGLYFFFNFLAFLCLKHKCQSLS